MSGMEDVVAVLHHAFRWDCEICGRENFERAISMEKEYIEAKVDGKLDEDGDYVLYPAIVVCKHCSAQYLASFQGLQDLEEEGE
tara:strand:+ start:485 stop:736 length:252 start_codon:yes stop_codon:yes gene_type:complete